MRVAITGANGFVGRTLVALLLEDTAASDIRAIVRDERRARSELSQAGLDIRAADVTRAETLRGAFDGADALVHTVAIPTERRVPRGGSRVLPGGSRVPLGGSEATFDDVNVRGVENVVAEAERAGVRRIVHISAIGASPESPYPFLRSKGRGQAAVTRSSVPHVVLRPSLLFGPGDDFFPRIGFTLRFPIVPVPGDGKSRFQPLHVADLALAIRAALRREGILGVHEVGGPAVRTYDELLREAMRAYGKWRPTVHLPVTAMKPAAAAMGLVMADPPVTVAQLDLLAVDNTPRDNAIERVFEITPRTFDLTYLRG